MTMYSHFKIDRFSAPDHALLVAGAAVSQAASATAALAERIAADQAPVAEDPLAALIGLFDGSADRDATPLRGSFHPRVAQASADKARSRLMKPGFTLAF